MPADNPTELFRALVGGPEADVPLDLAALLIAAHGPGKEDLDVDAARAAIDDLAAGVPEPTLAGLVSHLFVGLGFTGDGEHYDDPGNSFLDEVVSRRRGIPITLSILAIEVGRRVGVPLVGIGMPGHFLIRHEVPPRSLLDPFSGGRFVDRDECVARVRAIAGPDVAFEDHFLDPVGTFAILARMLNNLRAIWVRADGPALGRIGPLRLAIPGIGPREALEWAENLSRVGRLSEGARFVDAAAALPGFDDQGRAWLRSSANNLRARLN